LSSKLTSKIDLLQAAYAAFNARDLDAALALMTPDVSWPKTFKGGFAWGIEEVRHYWMEQWSELDPHVEPVSFHLDEGGQIVVKVHQRVKDLAGNELVDGHVSHRFTFADGLIQVMEVSVLPSPQL
jgi:hypothetical protein